MYNTGNNHLNTVTISNIPWYNNYSITKNKIILHLFYKVVAINNKNKLTL